MLSKRLVVVCVVVSLLCMCMVGLGLKLGNLHAETLMSLAAIHHDMLALVSLAIHGELIEGGGLRERRRARRRWGVGVEF